MSEAPPPVDEPYAPPRAYVARSVPPPPRRPVLALGRLLGVLLGGYFVFALVVFSVMQPVSSRGEKLGLAAFCVPVILAAACMVRANRIGVIAAAIIAVLLATLVLYRWDDFFGPSDAVSLLTVVIPGVGLLALAATIEGLLAFRRLRWL